VNETLRVIENRRSVRAFQDRPVDRDTVNVIVRAAMHAPTAGNMMLYSIIEIADQAIKDQLALSCDNQPFIATAPLVLLFLTDYQRWFDFILASGVQELCAAESKPLRTPGEGDLLLACCDALIAAQTAVIAAESLGIGSCYIGDIIERYEVHRDLFDLPQYAFPICLVCFGYPKASSSEKKRVERFPQEIIYFQNTYHRLSAADQEAIAGSRRRARGIDDAKVGQLTYSREFAADFSVEMTRSVKAAIQAWTRDTPAPGSESVEQD